jgi:flagellin
MTAQIRGLNQAQRNANDGISLAQTAEGAMQEYTNIIQRMREIAVQSANETNNATDRKSLNQEYQDLRQELDRIAKTTSFNGQNVLDGSLTNAQFQVGANVGETIEVNLDTSMRTRDVGTLENRSMDLRGASNDESLRNFSESSMSMDSLKGLGSGEWTVNGTQIDGAKDSGAGRSSHSAYAIAEAINTKSNETGVTARATAAEASFSNPEGSFGEGSYSLTINGETVVDVADQSGLSNSDVMKSVNAASDKTGVEASMGPDGELQLSASDGRNIEIQEEVTGNAATLQGTTPGGGDAEGDTGAINSVYRGGIELTGRDVSVSSSNANAEDPAAGNAVLVSGEDGAWSYSASDTSVLDDSNVLSVSASENAIQHLDVALDQADSFRATLGAVQNRFQSSVANARNTAENVSAARSRIMDADIAKETAELTQNSITQQAGVSILSQANQQPQIALQLLGGG